MKRQRRPKKAGSLAVRDQTTSSQSSLPLLNDDGADFLSSKAQKKQKRDANNNAVAVTKKQTNVRIVANAPRKSKSTESVASIYAPPSDSKTPRTSNCATDHQDVAEVEAIINATFYNRDITPMLEDDDMFPNHQQVSIKGVAGCTNKSPNNSSPASESFDTQPPTLSTEKNRLTFDNTNEMKKQISISPAAKSRLSPLDSILLQTVELEKQRSISINSNQAKMSTNNDLNIDLDECSDMDLTSPSETSLKFSPDLKKDYSKFGPIIDRRHSASPKNQKSAVKQRNSSQKKSRSLSPKSGSKPSVQNSTLFSHTKSLLEQTAQVKSEMKSKSPPNTQDQNRTASEPPKFASTKSRIATPARSPQYTAFLSLRRQISTKFEESSQQKANNSTFAASFKPINAKVTRDGTPVPVQLGKAGANKYNNVESKETDENVRLSSSGRSNDDKFHFTDKALDTNVLKADASTGFTKINQAKINSLSGKNRHGDDGNDSDNSDFSILSPPQIVPEVTEEAIAFIEMFSPKDTHRSCTKKLPQIQKLARKTPAKRKGTPRQPITTRETALNQRVATPFSDHELEELQNIAPDDKDVVQAMLTSDARYGSSRDVLMPVEISRIDSCASIDASEVTFEELTKDDDSDNDDDEKPSTTFASVNANRYLKSSNESRGMAEAVTVDTTTFVSVASSARRKDDKGMKRRGDDGDDKANNIDVPELKIANSHLLKEGSSDRNGNRVVSQIGLSDTLISSIASDKGPSPSAFSRVSTREEVPLWTVYHAKCENTVFEFTLNDGSKFRHPPLPPGWTMGFSKSQNAPYYCHPDFGRSFYPPVLLPSKDGHIRAVVKSLGSITSRYDIGNFKSPVSVFSDTSNIDDQQKTMPSINQKENLSPIRYETPVLQLRHEAGALLSDTRQADAFDSIMYLEDRLQSGNAFITPNNVSTSFDDIKHHAAPSSIGSGRRLLQGDDVDYFGSEEVVGECSFATSRQSNNKPVEKNRVTEISLQTNHFDGLDSSVDLARERKLKSPYTSPMICGDDNGSAPSSAELRSSSAKSEDATKHDVAASSQSPLALYINQQDDPCTPLSDNNQSPEVDHPLVVAEREKAEVDRSSTSHDLMDKLRLGVEAQRVEDDADARCATPQFSECTIDRVFQNVVITTARHGRSRGDDDDDSVSTIHFEHDICHNADDNDDDGSIDRFDSNTVTSNFSIYSHRALNPPMPVCILQQLDRLPRKMNRSRKHGRDGKKSKSRHAKKKSKRQRQHAVVSALCSPDIAAC